MVIFLYNWSVENIIFEAILILKILFKNKYIYKYSRNLTRNLEILLKMLAIWNLVQDFY